jgi:hypothetical protein
MVIAMLVMPGFPALHYYFGTDKAVLYNSDIQPENNGSLISDINYLNALAKRTADIKDCDKSKAPAPPKPQKEGNGFIYLLTDISLHLQLTAKPFKFKPYINIWHNRFIPTGNPPPKA